jgi:putative FmdB family regulatory protein
MPTYEYACRSCGHHLEVAQSFSDEPLTTCPNCEGPLRKVFGSIGIVLKGSGFYKTDSRPAPADAKSSGDGAAKRDAPAAGTKSGSSAGDSASGGGSSSGSGSDGSSGSSSTSTTKPAAASSGS